MYPTEGILPEMFDECIPELKNSGSSIARRFVKDLIRPYEEAVLFAMWSAAIKI